MFSELGFYKWSQKIGSSKFTFSTLALFGSCSIKRKSKQSLMLTFISSIRKMSSGELSEFHDIAS
jgi:hypothetical protein